MRRVHIFLLFFLIFFTLGNAAILEKGFVVVSEEELEAGIVNLSGEMLFFHEELFESKVSEEKKGGEYIQSANSWNNQPEGYESYDALGYGTYQFRIQIPEVYVGTTFLIRPTHFIAYASDIYVNGKLCSGNGKVGVYKDDPNYEPSRNTESCSFIADSSIIELSIQVANFHHFRGGIFKPIVFGLEKQVWQWRERTVTLDLLAIVSLLIMFVYHLIMYFVNTKQKTSLYFSLVCLVFSADLSFQGPMCFFLFFPEAPFDIYAQLHLITPYLIPTAFILFFKSLFPNYISKKIINMSIIFSLIFSLATVFGGMEIRNFVIKPNYFWSVFLILYIIVASVRLLKHRVFGARLFIVSFSLFAVCAINDILSMFELIQTINLLTYGIVSFAFLLSVLYGRQTSRLHDETLQLTNDLKHLNDELENKVQLRTEELNNSMLNLNKLHKFQEGMTNLIAHDLKNPLMQILNIEYVREKDYPALKNSGQHMLNMIQNMLDLYKFNNDRIVLNKSNFDVSEAIEEVIQEFSFYAQKKSVRIELLQHYTFFVNADLQLFKRVVTNFMSNALRFSPVDGLVKVCINVVADEYLRLSVSNQGPHIESHILDTIFSDKAVVSTQTDKFQKTSGVGLYLSKMAIEIQGGRIGVISDQNQDVEFWFEIPGVNKKVNNDENHIFYFDQSFILSTGDMVYLKPFATEISKLEVFEASKIDDVLDLIDKRNDEIKWWVLAVQKSCYVLDSEKLKKVINLVLNYDE